MGSARNGEVRVPVQEAPDDFQTNWTGPYPETKITGVIYWPDRDMVVDAVGLIVHEAYDSNYTVQLFKGVGPFGGAGDTDANAVGAVAADREITDALDLSTVDTLLGQFLELPLAAAPWNVVQRENGEGLRECIVLGVTGTAGTGAFSLQIRFHSRRR